MRLSEPSTTRVADLAPARATSWPDTYPLLAMAVLACILAFCLATVSAAVGADGPPASAAARAHG